MHKIPRMCSVLYTLIEVIQSGKRVLVLFSYASSLAAQGMCFWQTPAFQVMVRLYSRASLWFYSCAILPSDKISIGMPVYNTSLYFTFFLSFVCSFVCFFYLHFPSICNYINLLVFRFYISKLFIMYSYFYTGNTIHTIIRWIMRRTLSYNLVAIYENGYGLNCVISSPAIITPQMNCFLLLCTEMKTW